MSDRWAVTLAVATALGAAAARGPSPVVGGLVVAIALVTRRPWLLCLGAAVLAGGLAARSWAGLDGVRAGTFDGVVTLVSDPRADGASVRVDVRARGRRLEARTTGVAAATAVRGRLAGDRLVVRGALRPLAPGPVAPWQAARHLSGRLTIGEVRGVLPVPPLVRATNGFRQLLERGAAHLPATSRSLFGGFVVGDDRQQPPLVADDFEAAGLVHLLAVSGQNVAFVLSLAAPGLQRLGLRARLGATVAVIGLFGVVTRFEPSVLRASAMAATRAVAATVGRPASALRLLALSVTALVLVDPMLVHAVGFRLSVGASLGIVVLAGRIEGRLPGPRWLAAPLAVTVAAQAGVAPVLLPVFGGIPVATLPANLLAAPAAGPVMMWGMTAGVVAGLGGGSLAAILHVPTRLLLGWVELVARVLGRSPLGELGWTHVGVIVAAGLAWSRAGPHRPVARLAVAVAIVGALSAPAIALRSGPEPGPLGAGAELVLARPSTVVVVDGRARPGPLLESTRRRGLRRIDVLVVRTASERAADAGALLDARWPVGVVLAPVGAARPGWVPVPPAGVRVSLGPGAVVEAIDRGGRLEIEVR
jgi:competence protein ComEC